MQNHEHLGAFQIFLVGLSIYVLLALLVEVALPLSLSTRQILLDIDTAICIVFIIDFIYRAHRANSKLQFMKWGWIDLISSIPAFPFLRVGRAVRVVRVLRLLRGVRSVKTIDGVLFSNRARGTLASAIFACVVLVTFSAIAILHVEVDPSSNIKSGEDALWWSMTTVTTVGYGDRFPVTTEGRVIGAALMLAGVGLFAVLAAAVASWFLAPSEASNEAAIKNQLDLVVKELALIRQELSQRSLKSDESDRKIASTTSK